MAYVAAMTRIYVRTPQVIRVPSAINPNPEWWEPMPTPATHPGVAWPTHYGYASVTFPATVVPRLITSLSGGTGANTWRGEWAAHNAGSGFSVFVIGVSGVIDLAGNALNITRGDFAVLGCTAPGQGGLVIVGDVHSINSNVTNFYWDHTTVAAGRVDLHGGTGADTRDSLRLAAGVGNGVFRNVGSLFGTDGTWDFSLTATNPKGPLDLIGCFSGIGLIEAGHTEGNHDRTMLIGRGYTDIMITHHVWMTGTTRNPILGGGINDGIIDYEHVFLANNQVYNVTQQDNPDSYWSQVQNTPSHLSIVGQPVPIHGPADPVDDNDNRFQPVVSGGGTIDGRYYVDDAYWLEERQSGRANYGYVTVNNGNSFEGQMIDKTLRIRRDGVRALGQASVNWSPDGRAILDTGPIPGGGMPARFNPHVLGSFALGDHHQVAGGRTSVELFIDANGGPHPKSRGALMQRAFDQLALRGPTAAGEEAGRPSHVSDLRLSANYDPGETDAYNEGQNDIYGSAYGTALASVDHTQDPLYPATPTGKDPVTGWPYLFIYAFRKCVNIETPTNWIPRIVS